MKRLFARFEAHPKEAGYLAMGGQIVGAGIIAVPHQRTTDEQRVIVKAGSIPEERSAKPAKLAERDRDARSTPKQGRREHRPDGIHMAEIGVDNIAFNMRRLVFRE